MFNSVCKKWEKKFWNSPFAQIPKEIELLNGKGLDKFFRFDAAVMFKYIHTDEASRVADTVDAAVSLLDTAKLVCPQFCLRSWCISSCSQKASFWKIHFITFHRYNSLGIIPQALGNLCIQVTRKQFFIAFPPPCIHMEPAHSGKLAEG